MSNTRDINKILESPKKSSNGGPCRSRWRDRNTETNQSKLDSQRIHQKSSYQKQLSGNRSHIAIDSSDSEEQETNSPLLKRLESLMNKENQASPEKVNIHHVTVNTVNNTLKKMSLHPAQKNSGNDILKSFDIEMSEPKETQPPKIGLPRVDSF